MYQVQVSGLISLDSASRWHRWNRQAPRHSVLSLTPASVASATSFWCPCCWKRGCCPPSRRTQRPPRRRPLLRPRLQRRRAPPHFLHRTMPGPQWLPSQNVLCPPRMPSSNSLSSDSSSVLLLLLLQLQLSILPGLRIDRSGAHS